MRFGYRDIRVGVAQDPEDDVAHLYIWANDGAGRRIQVIIKDTDTLEERVIPEGARAPSPSLVLPAVLLDAIRRQPSDTHGDDVRAHLKDAITVRDRLLAMAEKAAR